MSALVSSNPDNANPTVYATGSSKRSKLGDFLDDEDLEDVSDEGLKFSGESSGSEDGKKGGDDEEELIDAQEVYDLIRSITDPEHPLTLEQLAVVSPEQIRITHGERPHVNVEFTPTIPHCSMATLIGLTLRVRLLRSLPERFKVDIRVKKGSHESENSLNKQLNDKERVAAALENNHLLEVVQNCLATSGQRGQVPKEV